MYRLVSLSFLLEIFDLKYGDGEWRGWDWEPGGGEVREGNKIADARRRKSGKHKSRVVDVNWFT